MKNHKIIPLIILILPLATAQAVTITINSASRQLVAGVANGPNQTNFSSADLGPLQASFQDDYTYSDASGLFPGSPTHAFAMADQNSSVNFSSGVLSITGSGDASALSVYAGSQEWFLSQAGSTISVSFTVNNPYHQPLYYSVTAVTTLSPLGYVLLAPGYSRAVELRQDNGGPGTLVFGFGDLYSYTTNSGSISGELLSPYYGYPYASGSYTFNATVNANGADTNTFAVQNSHFEFTFTVSPVPPLSIDTSSSVMALRWPASAINAVLEATTNLSDSASWAAVTNVAVIVGDMASVTIDTTQQPSQFFRLKTTQP